VPDFIKRQLSSAIPVLVDTSDGDEFVLDESRAISRYPAAVSKEGAELVPNATDRKAVARFDQGLLLPRREDSFGIS
jgi:glutathione S-transferase